VERAVVEIAAIETAASKSMRMRKVSPGTGDAALVRRRAQMKNL
jgi:hypothetical protein